MNKIPIVVYTHTDVSDLWPMFFGEFTTLYDFLEQSMYIDSEFHNFATSIENNRGDLSNSIAFYKWWMVNNKLWDNRINLDTTWE
jgi:hypothetical protein